MQVGNQVPEDRLCECVNVILSYQNFDGGMATYENTRSFHCLEVGEEGRRIKREEEWREEEEGMGLAKGRDPSHRGVARSIPFLLCL